MPSISFNIRKEVILWLLSAIFIFYKYLLQMSPSVISTDLMHAFSTTGLQLGNLTSCFYYTYLIMQIPAGILVDRFNLKWILPTAVLISAFGALLFAVSNTLILAEISRALMGIGTSFALISNFKLTSIFKLRYFALISGLNMTAAMLGAISGELPLSLMRALFGWRQTLACLGLFGLLLAVGIFILMRNLIKTEKLRCYTNLTLHIFQIKTVIKNRQAWLVSICNGLSFAPLSVFAGLWGVLYFNQTASLNIVDGAKLVTFIFIGFAIGCPLSGWISSLTQKRKNLILIGNFFSLITFLLIVYFASLSTNVLIIVLFLFGLSTSCSYLCFTLIGELFPSIFLGTVLGIANAFAALCEAITELMVGKLIDINWDGKLLNNIHIFSKSDYQFAFMIMPIYLIVTLMILLFIKEKRP